MITGKTYDVLKFVAQILLPAIGTLYFGLAGIWGLPSAEEVVGSIVVIDTFLGVLLGVSQKQYLDNNVGTGDLLVGSEDGMPTMKLELDEDDGLLADKDEVRFKVKKGPPYGK